MAVAEAEAEDIAIQYSNIDFIYDFTTFSLSPCTFQWSPQEFT